MAGEACSLLHPKPARDLDGGGTVEEATATIRSDLFLYQKFASGPIPSNLEAGNDAAGSMNPDLRG